jgi:MFS transporter, CP family, cyanate transporter
VKGTALLSSETQTDQSSLVIKPISPVIALGAIVAVALALRPSIVSVGPILSAIIGEFRLSHTMASLMTSIPDLLMGLFALPTPWLASRFGRDLVLLIALLVLGLSTLGRAFAPNTTVLLGTTAGVGIGIAVAGALVAGFIKARFPSRAALMMGLYATSLSLGSTIAAAVTGPIAMHAAGGWRVAAGIWSALSLIGFVAWLAVAASERRHHDRVAVTGAINRLPILSPKAWLVALFFACQNFLFYGVLTWIAPMYQEAGTSPAKAGLILATFTTVFTIANPIFGWLSHSEDRRRWLALSACLALVGLTALALAPLSAPFLWISAFAFGLGGAFTLGMTLPLDNTNSAAEANTWNAFVMTVGYVIAAAGPLAVGRLRDATGNFTLAFQCLAGVAILMAALTPFLRPLTSRRAA